MVQSYGSTDACVIYLKWYCKIADDKLQLHDVSEEHKDKILHEKYALVTKLHTINKAWAHFGLKG